MMSKAEAKVNRELSVVGKDNVPRIETRLSESQTKKLKIVSTRPNIPDLNAEPCSDSDREEGDIVEKAQTFTDLEAQDAENVVPLIFQELQVEIFARLPCFEYWKLHFLNKRFSKLVKSCEIFRLRRELGIVKPYVCVLSGSDTRWTMFDEKFENSRKLPQVPTSDYCFFYGDKETISAGTHLIVIAQEMEGTVVWRYKLEMHEWFKGPAMITPRTMYGSASRGTDAFFAGGIKMNEKRIHEAVSMAEKYNADTETWTQIHGMHKRRKASSGCFTFSVDVMRMMKT